jgi:multiple RNA-binding domain-containing protein 1
MASSRIYVSGLPPNITEPDFRKHFSKFQVTDVKLIPKRRIAFVGYHSSDEAAKAVKYFNRSFIRLSKIRVEFATPPKQITSHAEAVHDEDGEHIGVPISAVKLDSDHKWQQDAKPKKRRREEADERDPKLQEYLELMQPGRAIKKAREADNPLHAPATTDLLVIGSRDGNESDDDYETLPNSLSKEARKGREVKTAAVPKVRQPETASTESKDNGEVDGSIENTLEDSILVKPAEKTDVADDDWLRQRTSRLLDLADSDDPESMVRPTLIQVTKTDETGKALEADEMVTANDAAADQRNADAGNSEHPEGDPMAELQKTGRLFLRNLAFDVSQDDILDLVEPMGPVKEVRHVLAFLQPLQLPPCDEPLIGTAYAIWRLMMLLGQYFSRCLVSDTGFLSISRLCNMTLVPRGRLTSIIGHS